MLMLMLATRTMQKHSMTMMLVLQTQTSMLLVLAALAVKVGKRVVLRRWQVMRLLMLMKPTKTARLSLPQPSPPLQRLLTARATARRRVLLARLQMLVQLG